jgi:hypothetical protein
VTLQPAQDQELVADAPTDEEILARRAASNRERQAAWRERQREQAASDDAPDTREHVGFVGCETVGLLKVRVHSRAKHNMEVACTCGEVHITTDPLIRERKPGEVVHLVEEGFPMQVGDDPMPPPTRAAKRPAPKSDAAVIAAIPAEWTLAADLAADLGYASRKSFRNRLREMRKRAEAKGEPPPFQSDSSTTGLKVRAA